MKIDSSSINHTKTLDSQSIKANQQSNYDNKIINDEFIGNGFSSLKNKELNNNIGILQAADKTISKILNDNNISLDDILNQLKDSEFFNKSIFAPNQIIKDSNDEVLFDANKILDILPHDKKDIYMFKKALRIEHNFILDSLNKIKKEIQTSDEQIEFNKDFLNNNSSFFSKAHNTDILASKIDMLLA